MKILCVVVVFLTCLGVPSSAGIITYTSRAGFDAQGTIVYNSNFDDFGAGFASPGDPFTRGDVTYTSENNLVVGSGTGYSIGAWRSVMSNNYWTPLTGSLVTSTYLYNLFGFDLAVTSGPVDITIYTSAGTYGWTGLTVPDGNPTFAFYGFQTTGGEYITGFRIDSLDTGYLPGMTDVAVGVSGGVVPEPGTAALLGFALGALALARKLRAR